MELKMGLKSCVGVKSMHFTRMDYVYKQKEKGEMYDGF